ncbi:MAG: hypothetical protein IH951_15515 [Bacteroidetes bacterium]|nr:hypothetical protein [Bacteroidota bacterium]
MIKNYLTLPFKSVGHLFMLIFLMGSGAYKSVGQDYVDTFEVVWRTVDETYFDSTFGGVDWKDLHDRYQPLIAEAENDEVFYRLVNEKLFELNTSHLGVVPPDEKEQIAPVLASSRGIGVDAKLLSGEAIITSVNPDSPGALAGLRPGFVIQRVDGKTIEQIAEEREMELTPPFNDRNRRSMITDDIRGLVYGTAGTIVSMSYLDEQGTLKETTIERVKRGERGERIKLGETLPLIYVEFDAKRLDSNIGYLRFNAFLPPVDERFLEVLEEMSDMDGLIIDLRGNPDGAFVIRRAIAEHLIEELTFFWSYKGRDGDRDVFLDPAERVYGGPLVVLVDVGSWSSSEEFAGGMQAIGRAVVIGERTLGKVLVQGEMELPNGAVLIYPTEQKRTAEGVVLEGRGVIPDLEITLERTLLSQGIDSQLEAAITYLENQKMR